MGFAAAGGATGALVVGPTPGVKAGPPDMPTDLAAGGGGEPAFGAAGAGAAGGWAGAPLVAGAGPPLAADGADAIAPVDPAGD